MTMEKGLAFMVRKYQLEQQDEGGRGLGRSGENYCPELKYVSPNSGITNDFHATENRHSTYAIEGDEETSTNILSLNAPKQFSCKICGLKFSQRENLRDHERCHPYGCLFICQICSLKFHRKDRLQNHQSRKHGLAHPGTGESILASTTFHDQEKEISMASLIRAVEKVKLQRYLKRENLSGKHSDQAGVRNEIEISSRKDEISGRLSLMVSLIDKPDDSKKLPRTPLLKSTRNKDESRHAQDLIDEPQPKKARFETQT